ncbi:hypothetical protein B566_EDAN011188 [Ephemera danica]|nr:hypothetical protein B566_EDAN011188 [Ephemera danica]
MSYPGRPQMVPGMPVGPPPGIQMSYMGLGAPPPLMSAIVPPHMIGPPPMGPGMPPAPTVRTGYRPPVTLGQNAMGRSPAFSKRVAETGAGPAVTVFVGNITERAPDAMIRHILAAYAGLRSVRLLHDLDLGGKRLVVKVDAKTKVVLDEFKDDRRRKLGTYGQKGGGGSPLQDEKPDEEDNMDYMDDDMKGADQSAMDRISAVIQDYEPDMKNYNPPNVEKERKVKTQEKLMKLGSGLDGNTGGDLTPNFDDGEMEEGKRDLITREIGKFREIMKVRPSTQLKSQHVFLPFFLYTRDKSYH